MLLRLVSAASLFAVALAAQAQSSPARPKITGISHLAVYTSNAAATDHYYREQMGAARLPDPENPKGVRYAFNAVQFVEVLPLPPGVGINRLDHTAYNTDNAEGLRSYLAVRGWKTPVKVHKGSDGSLWFAVNDPEGNKVEFVQPPRHPKQIVAPNAIGHRIIHVGFLVHSREAEDKFYRDLLDFRPYWWGGRGTDRLDWVAQQTPDAPEWLEYMMVHDGSTSGIPPTMSAHELGVMDHLSIGVNSVDAVFKTLKDSNRLAGAPNDGKTQIGLDGKVQFNAYDPDGIRLELMTFHAVQKPCCSPFTAPDPSE